MTNRVLGDGLTVSAVGLGCMGFSHAYGAPMEKSESIHNIRAALDMGYTLFDTAEVYGTQDNPPPKRDSGGRGAEECPRSCANRQQVWYPL